MADAVPVSDVLCEAIEYLSKFGSNLKVRSENLKEKRIRKDKLRNAHAVQKAASKVLLICELSKKSILNVETGVKNVLKQIDLALDPTSSDGGNSSYKSSKVEKDTKYEYIEYDSHKLRIRKKVDVNHFQSVKVLARSIPVSMQDKYPVYYNCKLYRQRQKKSKDPEHVSDREDNLTNPVLSKDNVCKDKATHKSQDEQMDCDTVSESKSQSKKLISKHSKRNSESENVRSDNEQSVSAEEKTGSSKNCETSQRHSDISLSENIKKSNTADRQNMSQSNKLSASDGERDSRNVDEKLKKKSKQSSQDIVLRFDVSSSSKSKVDSNNSKHRKPSSDDSKTEKCKKFRNIKVFNDSTESDESQNPRVVPEKSDTLRVSKDADDNKTDKKTDTSTEKDKNIDNSTAAEIVELNDSSDDETEKNKLCETNNIANDSGCKTEKNANIDKKTATTENDASVKDTSKDSNPRPLIRCVSLDKLLKKSNNEAKTQEKSPSNTKSKRISTILDKSSIKQDRKRRKKNYKEPSSSEESEEKIDSDEEYWIQKRKEVKQFNSKNFSINVKRLPELSEKYLCEHNLQRITQNGSIICEVVQKVEKKDEIHSKNSDTPDVNSAKYALLDDSDSGKSKDTPRKVKRALLQESGSEKEENPSSPGPDENSKDKEKSDSEKPNNSSDQETRNNKTPEPENRPRKLKRALKESESEKDRNSSPGLGEKNKDESDGENMNSTSDQERRNCKTSETENTPGKIKKALLKESGSEEEKNPSSPGSSENNNENKSKDNKLITASDVEHKNNKTPEHETVNRDLDNNEELKSSLLRDSTDENNKTPAKKITQNVSTPLSKRKHIMESMRAKKMLLTYSSSSDTEDEQLRGVLKEIRDDLLKEQVSDEGNKKNEHDTEKLPSDSDSSVKNKKRKRCDSSEKSVKENPKAAVSDDGSSAKDNSSHVGENVEGNSDSSVKKVRRK